MNLFLVVLKKELKDSFRDRRGVLLPIVFVMLGPLLMISLLRGIAEERKDPQTQTLQVIGQEHAPDLIGHLEKSGLEIEEFTGDPKTEIQNKTVQAILSIPEDFGEKFKAFEPAPVQLYFDDSLEKSETAADNVARAINEYSQTIGTYRLVLRGVNPAVMSAVRLEHKDFSTRSSRAGQILGTLQMLILIASFFGGMGVAIDTTAGERERNSLEPLLVHPVSSFQLAAGKWVTVMIYGMAASLVGLLSTAICLELFSLKALGVDPKLTLQMQLAIFATLIPMALLAAAAQMLMSLFAKTFKEAQTYLGLLNLVPMVPVMILMFKEFKSETWMYAVPVLGQQQLMTSVMRGESLSALHFVIAAASTSALGIALFAILVRLLRSERVVYGG